jgi:hypothetical protein
MHTPSLKRLFLCNTQPERLFLFRFLIPENQDLPKSANYPIFVPDKIKPSDD